MKNNKNFFIFPPEITFGTDQEYGIFLISVNDYLRNVRGVKYLS